jgi:hypothetical protein
MVDDYEPTNEKIHAIPVVTNNGDGVSFFSIQEIPLEGTVERLLSDQQSAVNFRWRESDASYASGFHVAGDPTLLVILSGTLGVELQNGEERHFSAGEYFIAEDYLSDDVVFDETIHGHRAYVMNGQRLSALHLKLDKR